VFALSDVIGNISEFLEISPNELFFAEGLDDNPEVLRRKIHRLIKRANRGHSIPKAFNRHTIILRVGL